MTTINPNDPVNNSNTNKLTKTDYSIKSHIGVVRRINEFATPKNLLKVCLLAAVIVGGIFIKKQSEEIYRRNEQLNVQDNIHQLKNNANEFDNFLKRSTTTAYFSTQLDLIVGGILTAKESVLPKSFPEASVQCHPRTLEHTSEHIKKYPHLKFGHDSIRFTFQLNSTQPEENKKEIDQIISGLKSMSLIPRGGTYYECSYVVDGKRVVIPQGHHNRLYKELEEIARNHNRA